MTNFGIAAFMFEHNTIFNACAMAFVGGKGKTNDRKTMPLDKDKDR